MKKCIMVIPALIVCNFLSAQCLVLSVTTTDATCTQTDGEIHLTITPGTGGNAQPPFNIDLYYMGSPDVHLASYSGVTFTQITFKQGDGSLNIPAGDAFGIPSNSYTEFGSTYRVAVTSSGGGTIICKNKMRTVTVDQSPDVVVTLDALSPDTGIGDGSISITPTGGTPPYTFSWLDGPTTEDRTGLSSGPYEVRVTDDDGCSSHFAAIVEDGSLANSVSEKTSAKGVAIFPNPASDYVTLKVPKSEAEVIIEILDFRGKQRLVKRGFYDQYQIRTSDLANGNYIIIVRRGKWSTTQRLNIKN